MFLTSSFFLNFFEILAYQMFPNTSKYLPLDLCFDQTFSKMFLHLKLVLHPIQKIYNYHSCLSPKVFVHTINIQHVTQLIKNSPTMFINYIILFKSGWSCKFSMNNIFFQKSYKKIPPMNFFLLLKFLAFKLYFLFHSLDHHQFFKCYYGLTLVFRIHQIYVTILNLVLVMNKLFFFSNCFQIHHVNIPMVELTKLR